MYVSNPVGKSDCAGDLQIMGVGAGNAGTGRLCCQISPMES
jgi:hypothetical protein